MRGDQGGYRQINKSLNICAFEDYLQSQQDKLPPLPDVEQITPAVLRVLGQNPGKFTFQGTNVFVVGTGKERIMIDTGGGQQAWASLIESVLAERGISIAHVLLTHWHGDHTGGVPDLIRLYPELEESIYKNSPDYGQQDIADGQIWQVEGSTVRAIHVPGHSHDHMCFVLEEESAMFTGDNILGTGTSAVEDLGTFMDSLLRMQDQDCLVGHPAHGVTIGNLPTKIKQELGQKARRERQVMKALEAAQGRGETGSAVPDLVNEIYGDALDGEIRLMALEPFTAEILRKLAGDGKVGYRVASGKRKWFLLKGR